MMIPSLSAALTWCKLYPVIPIKPRDKIPLTAHGLKDSSQFQATIQEWWRRWPNANIGILCNGLLVLDFDVKERGLSDGKPALIAKYGELPKTRVHRTGGGGEHWLYKVPTDLNIRPGAKKYGFAGLDIRANDSYILVPPSVTSGQYQVIDDSPIAPAAGWLIELAKTPVPDRIIAAPGDVILEGQRNATLASLAGSMRRRGASQDAIAAALTETNRQCSPPLPDREVAAIAGSVSRYEPAPQGGNGHKTEPVKLPELKCIDTIAPENVSWLWPPYIPAGKLTMIEGDPGTGKSWVTLAIATAVSLGVSLPNSDPLPAGPVIIASAEDGLADTIRPRLDAMGADLSRIKVIDGLFTLDDVGFNMLEQYVTNVMPELVVIDPLVAYLSGDMDINKANQVRYATARLAKLAETYYPAILAVRHLTKGGSAKPIYRGLGSIDFTAAARSVLLAGIDPETQSRGIVHIKCNLAPLGQAIGYELKDGGFYWSSSSDLTAARILAVDDGTGGSAGNEAEIFLLDMLGNGPVLAAEIFSEAERQDISSATLKRAKSKMGVLAEKETGKGRAGKWCWKLPEKFNKGITP